MESGVHVILQPFVSGSNMHRCLAVQRRPGRARPTADRCFIQQETDIVRSGVNDQHTAYFMQTAYCGPGAPFER